MGQLSQKTQDFINFLKKKYGVLIIVFVILAGLVFILLPKNGGTKIVVLDANGNFSHRCDCENKPPVQGDSGGWKWRSAPAGKTCPTTQIPCPPK